MSQTKRKLELNGITITLVGTAHVSKESIDEVTTAIKDLSPDCVAIELDEKRADSIQNPEKYAKLDIVKVLKKGQGFLMLANIILSSFQRRIGMNTGVKPGDEMLAAMNTAKELNIKTAMVDRPVQITLKRAWSQSSLWGKCKLLASLLTSAFSKEEIEAEEIENLKNTSEMDSMMNELAEYMPVIKEVIIDERNKYLAAKIWETGGKNIVAVLGAGHLQGVEEYLEKIAAGTESTDVENIMQIKKGSITGKIIGWLIPISIIGLFIGGFIYGGVKGGTQMLSTWFLWNAIPAAIMTLLGLGHPLTIIVAFVGAPFTSLCPFVGIGFLTAIVQALVCPPKVSDMETLQNDVTSIKGFYKNRILRTLLILILSTIGSMIGTFAGGADVIKTFNQL